jgi:lipopolysaccharide/colanic/teichoic acid biosynthesis glycosyltransferase
MKAAHPPFEAEPSAADLALSRALEREREKQPELHYEQTDDSDSDRASRRTRSLTALLLLLGLIGGALALIATVLSEDSPALSEGAQSALALIGGAALGIGLGALPTRPRSQPRNIGKRRTVELILKRAVDFSFSCLALFLMAPVLVVIALALKFEDPQSPIIFGRELIGRDGRLFRLLKFRTLRKGAEGVPTLGRLGSLLRAYGLDELPMFVNVLRGEMSLVGPRPISPVERLQTAWWRSPTMRPGVVGPAAVYGVGLSVQERESLDLAYEETWSPLVDTRIVLGTLRFVLSQPKD